MRRAQDWDNVAVVFAVAVLVVRHEQRGEEEAHVENGVTGDRSYSSEWVENFHKSLNYKTSITIFYIN